MKGNKRKITRRGLIPADLSARSLDLDHFVLLLRDVSLSLNTVPIEDCISGQ